MSKKQLEGEFFLSQQCLSGLSSQVLDLCKAEGATQASVDASESYGLSVTVRQGDSETVEFNRDKSCSVNVYVGQRRGSAATSDFSPTSIDQMVKKAVSIARFTESDTAAGLPEEDELFSGEIPDLSLFHPWDLTPVAAMELACSCEEAGLGYSSEIRQSEGVTVSTVQNHFISANSSGFQGGYSASRHLLSCSFLAGVAEGKQRDGWFSSQRDWIDLADPVEVGVYAAKRTLSRLGARQVSTQQVPVIFEAPVAISLLGHLAVAASGHQLYRKMSFLNDSCGQQVFPDFIQLEEDPFIAKGLASSPFDDDGVVTKSRLVVDRGILTGYFLSVYSARKMGLKTTGNAGGTHNLCLLDTGQSLEELINLMGRGLLITELIGFGVNYLTGDYSRGASGYWVENGAIQFPVEEVTIAANLRDMFRHIVAVGTDQVVRGSKRCGSVLIDRMTVAGS
ncbi:MULTISPECIES: metalloprotease PmbA [Candidatus Ichthyocystis]|uniref:Peptidase n=1 Tax=Candidatus Ichthyocystis hellenicum TaxID=1561003 RepID=A0A0S4M418_9BURK|nr:MULTISPECIES: metalloprotease PmbA [Ichthyocystis]CUT17046.1 peptidase [Candidatus Ichthyocystis hellenicum]